ncbi:MAG TPA: YfhO family protein [Thermoanaerobaculia bacterium]|nr:YfhO family protein [Thermoanaerobaculia bacterium]
MNLTWLYIGLLYSVAVMLARRGGIELRRRIAALLYLLVLIFLFRPMTQAFVNVPVDFLRSLPPWVYVNATRTSANNDLNDLPLQIIPWAHQVRHSLRMLQFPLWNSAAGGGYPLLANGQSAALSPLRLLALPLPLAQSFAAEAAMKLLIAMTFTFLWARRRGWSELASAVAAVSFAFGTFMIVWLHFPLATVAAFLPAVLYQLDLVAEKRTYTRIVAFALIWASILYGGHPEAASHIGFLGVLYMTWIALVERSVDGTRDSYWRNVRQFLGAAAVGGIIAVLLAMPFLAPFAEALPRSKRFQQLTAKPNVIGAYSDYRSAVVLFQPHFFGATPVDQVWGPENAETLTGFAGILGIVAWLAVALRAMVERRWREIETFLALAALLTLGIILAWPLVSDLFHLIFKFAANGRLRLLFGFVLALLAGAATETLLRGGARYVLAGTAIVAGAMALLFFTTRFPGGWARDNAILAALPSMVVLSVAAIMVALPRAQRASLLVLAAAIIAELWSVGAGWNPVVDSRLFYPREPLIEELQIAGATQPPNAPFRIVGFGAALFPNTAPMYGFEDIRAHDPMSNGRYLGVLRVVAGYDADEYFANWKNQDTRLLDFLNVRFIVTPPDVELHDRQRYRVIRKESDGYIYENNDVLPRFFPSRNVIVESDDDRFADRLKRHDDWAHTTLLRRLPLASDRERSDLLSPRPASAPEARLAMIETKPTDFRMHVTAPRATLVVSGQPFWPGWHVRCNGRNVRMIEANGAFLSFIVPPGESDVRVYYRPLSFTLGLTTAMIALAGLVAVPILRR